MKLFINGQLKTNFSKIAVVLQPGERIDRTTTYTYTIQCAKYKIVLDPDNTIAETNENDNTWQFNPCVKSANLFKSSQ